MHILTNLKRVLEIYSRVSGQQINFHKSELCGSNNIDEMFKYMLAEYMGMKAVDKHTKYLGLPLIVGQNKEQVFRSLEDKMSKRIQDWGALLLSAAGKEALSKSCFLSVPLYTMNCFRLPKTFCDKLMAMAIKFWWNNNSRDREYIGCGRNCCRRRRLKGDWASGIWKQ
ncbi:hypothetical protein QQ045_001334 [Rhodiola kirilowii]